MVVGVWRGDTLEREIETQTISRKDIKESKKKKKLAEKSG